MTAPKGVAAAAKRFIVWRTYHQLAERLGRIPTVSEVAAEADLIHATTYYHMLNLNTCRVRRIGRVGIHEGGDFDRTPGDHPIDVYTYIMRHAA